MAMGIRRTGYFAVGPVAVMRAYMLVLLAAPMALSGCNTLSAIAGAAAGAATGAATTNPIVGYAVGIGVKTGVDGLQRYVARVRANAGQDVIATAVGEMNVGETREWKIVHTLPPWGGEHGEVQVTRLIETPLALCKEVLFSVNEGEGPKLHRTLLTTDACRNTQGWKWAQAEPAVDRWGYFQRIH